ncbi:DNA topoisomerase, partial [Lactarius deliciosus]
NLKLLGVNNDSAKALTVASLGVVGCDNFSVFLLHGKLLNVSEARYDQIMKNEETQNIKKIMGLQHNKDYSDVQVRSSRYSQLMIMTDEGDHDGLHIKGLLINFWITSSRLCCELIDLIFSKKKSDDRKEWLQKFTPGTYLDHDTDEISYSDFINKELILFSMPTMFARSLRPAPCWCLERDQRKVIWACFEHKSKKESSLNSIVPQVAQLVGYISEHAGYHHGKQSLTMTIVNFA